MLNPISKISIKVMLMAAFLSVGVIATITLGLISYYTAKSSLIEQSYNNLRSVRDLKAKQVEDYVLEICERISTFSEEANLIQALEEFKGAYNDISVEINTGMTVVESGLKEFYIKEFLSELNKIMGKKASLIDYYPKSAHSKMLQYLYLSQNEFPSGSKQKLVNSDDGSRYSRLHGRHHPIFREFACDYGYDDILLVDNNTGIIVYSILKDSDFGSSLLEGPYRGTHLAEVFNDSRRAGLKNFVKVTDFSPYEPSFNKLRAFISSPVFAGDTIIGVLVFKITVDRIIEVMSDFKGHSLGSSGESYIVGEDSTLRSHPRLFIEESDKYFSEIERAGVSNEVIESIRNTNNPAGIQKIETSGASKALSGIAGEEIYFDYKGTPVLSSFKPLNIKDNKWAIVCKLNEDEALRTALNIRSNILLVSVFIIIAIALCGLVFCHFIIVKRITRPISDAVVIADRLATGDLTARINIDQDDELGSLGAALNEAMEKLESLISEIATGTRSLTDVTDQIGDSNQVLSRRAAEKVSMLEDIASAIDDTSTAINKNAENAKFAKIEAGNTSNIAYDSAGVVNNAIDAINEINKSSKQIADIIAIINEISFQTNLLALNAAVEAARAGEMGKGFAVVAGEVRDLAQRSARAAKEITALINESVEKIQRGTNLVNKSGVALYQITESVSEVSSTISEIAGASHEQKTGIDQINAAITEINSIIQKDAELMEKTALASRDLAELANKLFNMVEKFNVNDKGTVNNKGLIRFKTEDD